MILSNNHIFNLKMRQIARILLTNDFKNENIFLQLKLDQCLKKLIFWWYPLPLCRPIFGIIICESLNLLVIQKNTALSYMGFCTGCCNLDSWYISCTGLPLLNEMQIINFKFLIFNFVVFAHIGT